jgi:RNA polymerase sigma-70 factor (ECF subfamily)
MDSVDPDGLLVRRAKAGDYPAFEELVSRHERRLFNLAARLLRQREDAENAVQTAFLNVLEHLDDFREESSFATWITRIVTNAALNILRKRSGIVTVPLRETASQEEEGEIPHPEYIADWRGDPARIVEERELRRILDEAIRALPEKLRLVFVLRDVEGLSVRETAQALGIGEANVKVRLLRARLALREKLTKVFGDETKRVPHAGHGEGGGPASTPAEVVLRSYQDR